jgi:type I restriction enzyme S subunit
LSQYGDLKNTGTTELWRLPEGWTWARADLLSTFITKGTTPAASLLHAGSGDVPYIKVYNLTFRGALDFASEPTFVDCNVHRGELARSRVLPGDVLMNIVGPPLGKVSVVPATFPEWNINQAIARFRPLPGVDGQYLSLVLRSSAVVAWAMSKAKATAGQFNLTLEICRALPVPLPPLAEQRRIVEFSDRLMSSVESLMHASQHGLVRSGRLRQSTLKWAFEGKLVDQDPDDEPASVLLERIRAERAARGESTSRKTAVRRKK